MQNQAFTDFEQFLAEMEQAAVAAFDVPHHSAGKILSPILYSILGTAMAMLKLAEGEKNEQYQTYLDALTVAAGHLPEAVCFNSLVEQIRDSAHNSEELVNKLEELRLVAKYGYENVKKNR